MIKQLAGTATAGLPVIELGITSEKESIVVDDVGPYITDLPHESSAKIAPANSLSSLRPGPKKRGRHVEGQFSTKNGANRELCA